MTIGNPEAALLKALRGAFAESRSICAAHPEPTGGIVILFLGHVRGIWRHVGSGFAFTPGGYTTATLVCGTIDEAVQHSLTHICRR